MIIRFTQSLSLWCLTSTTNAASPIKSNSSRLDHTNYGVCVGMSAACAPEMASERGAGQSGRDMSPAPAKSLHAKPTAQK